MSSSELINKIDETCCCDRFFGQVVVTGYSYMFGTWLMHLFMVQVVGKCLIGSVCLSLMASTTVKMAR